MRERRERTAEVSIRPRRAADDNFLLTLGERAFAAYSSEPGRSVAFMLAEAGAEAAVAEVGRARVGFAIVAFEQLPRDFGPWTRPVIARLNAIAVRPSAQGRGVGGSLLAWVEEIARSRGAVCLTLNTAETNARARGFFKWAGFLPVAKLPDQYIDGQAAIGMNKLL